MKKLNRAVVIGLVAVVAASVLVQGTPSLAAQNVISKTTVVPKYEAIYWIILSYSQFYGAFGITQYHQNSY